MFPAWASTISHNCPVGSPRFLPPRLQCRPRRLVALRRAFLGPRRPDDRITRHSDINIICFKKENGTYIYLIQWIFPQQIRAYRGARFIFLSTEQTQSCKQFHLRQNVNSLRIKRWFPRIDPFTTVQCVYASSKHLSYTCCTYAELLIIRLYSSVTSFQRHKICER